MKSIFKATIIITLLIFLVSCKKSWLDVNSDPNNSQTGTVQLVFPTATMGAASVIGGQFAILGGIWSQYYTQSPNSNQYKQIDQYNLTAADFHNQFARMYTYAFKNFKYVREQATKDQNWDFVFIATIMEAYAYQVMVDLYDQIPYNDALQGDQLNFSAHFDKGQAVYDSLIKKINDVLKLDLTAVTSTNPGTSDFIFGGDMNKWRQFANTLKLKIYLRECYARPDIASAGIAATAADKAGFLTEDAAITGFIDSPDKDNPMYDDNIRSLNAIDNLKASKTFLNWLADNSDPRIAYLFAQTGGQYVGLDQGNYTTPSLPAAYSTLLQSPTDPVYFISGAESYFLQAEAVLRGYFPGDTVSLYNNGVIAAFGQFGIADSANKFINQGGKYAYRSDTTSEAQLEKIIVQKWASMAGTHGLEAFFEHNRTHYPLESTVPNTDSTYVAGHLTYSVNGVTGGLFPKRLLFPDYESERNPNTPALKPVTAKVWWDVNSK